MLKNLIFVFGAVILLTACGGGEEGIPDNAIVSTCVAGDTYMYICLDKDVYEFYVNDELQPEGMQKIVQDAVNDRDSARDYLDFSFGTTMCEHEDYVAPE